MITPVQVPFVEGGCEIRSNASKWTLSLEYFTTDVLVVNPASLLHVLNLQICAVD